MFVVNDPDQISSYLQVYDEMLQRFPETDFHFLSVNPINHDMMVEYGYAETKEQAIKDYLNKLRTEGGYILPEEAIAAIRASGGVPVLAHPSFGRGDELITGGDMDRRLRRLIGFGLEGVEAFYSGFTPGLRDEMLGFAERYGLYVTAGSDYHGKNKSVRPGETGLTSPDGYPEGLIRFLHRVGWDNNTGGNI